MIAHAIVLAYPSLAEASAPDEDGHAAVYSDARIGGGASMIAEALNVLRLAKDPTAFEEAATYGRDRWYRSSGAGETAVAAGQKQADDVAPLLKQSLREWAW